MSDVFWLKCKAVSGQFSDELALSGSDFQGEIYSLFVSCDFVDLDGDPKLGEVDARVRVLVLDRKDGLALIRLPGQTFGNGSAITVKESDLQPDYEVA